ncbi:hypothetical protein [Enterovibrio calviensis]|uniref:hypothetical protein n=1 Tax=Enterovibrio calviensis TaxID=91359 RepID=UPI0004854DB0|nr:hypothetical protein [Enterovibrio calviensis]
MTFKNNLFGRSLILAIVVLTSIFPIWFAQVNADPAPRTLQDFFIDASSGESKAREVVLTSVASLLRQYPNDPLLTAYYGSTLSMKARDSWFPWKQKEYIELGFENLNKSLMLLSIDSYSKPYYGLNEGIFIRSIAAITFVNSPEHLHQKERGYEMLKHMMASEHLQNYPFGPQAWIHIGAVEAALDMKENDMAKMWAQNMQKLAPTHPMTKKALSLTSKA